MKKYISMFVASLMLVSCVDTIILPDDKTVDEDFWQTKGDVASMVSGAYAVMASNDVLTRLIIWGDFRTDEVLRNSGVTDVSATTQALDEIAAVNIQTTNMFATWSQLYDVINRCNIVLERAEGVMMIDPNYTLGDYQVDRSQMLALRALCYFYLVRNFRDVPFITEAYMNSSQSFLREQTAPATIIDQCIADLEGCVSTAMSPRSYGTGEWRRVGWLTSDGINALLADLYLWRASVTHSAADYRQCVAICDRVIASKKAQHIRGRNELTEKEYPLADAEDMYYDLFVSQNAEESIFELQNRSNLPLCQFYYKYKSASATAGMGWLKATPIFAAAAPHSVYNATTILSNSALFSSSDMRYYAACFIPGTGEDSYDIRKMICEVDVSTKVAQKTREAYDYGGRDHNFNIYRLSDVMLMKAEAMVQLAEETPETATDEEKAEISARNEALLRPAFNMVQAVNTRALHAENQADSLKWNTFKDFSKDQFEQLVMQERMREFCFEGRRWYDLLRYNYRHVQGVDYGTILADQSTLVRNYDEMLTLMTRQRGTDASGVKAKMANEAYLYMPIPNSDILVCPALKQNPVYKSSNDFEKSY